MSRPRVPEGPIASPLAGQIRTAHALGKFVRGMENSWETLGNHGKVQGMDTFEPLSVTTQTIDTKHENSSSDT